MTSQQTKTKQIPRGGLSDVLQVAISGRQQGDASRSRGGGPKTVDVYAQASVGIHVGAKVCATTELERKYSGALDKNGKCTDRWEVKKTAAAKGQQIPTLESISKYWFKRDSLFENFDNKGILLDGESLFSVCPEAVAKYLSDKCVNFKSAIDPFCGCGGIIIQLAKTCKKVIGSDIDNTKIKLADHNTKLFNVNVDLRIADFFVKRSSRSPVDVLVTSPPWGGPEYNSSKYYNIGGLCDGRGLVEIIQKAEKCTKNQIFHLPRNTNPVELYNLGAKRVELVYLNGYPNCLLAYFGTFEPNTSNNVRNIYLTSKSFHYPSKSSEQELEKIKLEKYLEKVAKFVKARNNSESHQDNKRKRRHRKHKHTSNKKRKHN